MTKTKQVLEAENEELKQKIKAVEDYAEKTYTALKEIRKKCRSQVWKIDDDCTIKEIVEYISNVLGGDESDV